MSSFKLFEKQLAETNPEKKAEMVADSLRSNGYNSESWKRHLENLKTISEGVAVARNNIAFYEAILPRFFESGLKEKMKKKILGGSIRWNASNFYLSGERDKLIKEFRKRGSDGEEIGSFQGAHTLILLYEKALRSKQSAIADQYKHYSKRLSRGGFRDSWDRSTKEIQKRLEDRRKSPFERLGIYSPDIEWVDTFEECGVLVNEKIRENTEEENKPYSFIEHSTELKEVNPYARGKFLYYKDERPDYSHRTAREVIRETTFKAMLWREREYPGGRRLYHRLLTLGAKLVRKEQNIEVWEAVWFRLNREKHPIEERGLIGVGYAMNGEAIVVHSKGTEKTCLRMLDKRLEADRKQWELRELRERKAGRIRKVAESLKKGSSYYVRKFADVEVSIKDAKALGYCEAGITAFLDAHNIDRKTTNSMKLKKLMGISEGQDLEMVARLCAYKAVSTERDIQKGIPAS